jgi:hypothetical protein
VTIHSRYEPQDLLYRFDAVKRLADAQLRDVGADWLEAREAGYWGPAPCGGPSGGAVRCATGAAAALPPSPHPRAMYC